MDINICLPEKVKLILDTLMAAGYEGYAVGGCVRDSLLSRIPEDWDITTSATPKQVKELFNRTIDTGIAHGTVTVMLGKEGFEVTTYRIDGEYEDGRHPKQVEYTSLLSEDLRRRDFSINAMAYNERDGLVDLFGGQEDLKRGVIRAVGCARDRFNEDALRIMRAVRFAAQLNYDIESETAAAAKELASNLKKISAERIHTELTKLMISEHPDKLRLAYRLGITAVVLPEFDLAMETIQNNPHHCYTVGEHTIHAFSNIEYGKYDKEKLTILRFGMLFHDLGKPQSKVTDEDGIDHFRGHPELGEEIAKGIMRRLKFDNKSIAAISSIVRYHDLRPRLTLPGMRRIINKVGLDTAKLLTTVQYADIMAQSDYQREEKAKRIEQMQDYFDRIFANNDPLFLKDLAINGKDLMAENLVEGKEIGVLLNHLLSLVLDRPEINQKETLLRLAREYKPVFAEKTAKMDEASQPSDIVY